MAMILIDKIFMLLTITFYCDCVNDYRTFQGYIQQKEAHPFLIYRERELLHYLNGE